MSEFKLRIFYSGLCVFVPQRDDAGKIDGMRALLADSVNGPEAERVPEHTPAIQFHLKNRVTDEPRHPLFTARDGTTRGLWILDQEDVDVVAVNGDLGGPLAVDETPPANLTTVTPQDSESFGWVLPLFDSSDQLAAADFDLGTRTGGGRVAACFHARHGKIFPASFSLDRTGERVQLWDLRVRNQRPRAVATLVEQRIPVDAPMVRLRARKFGDPDNRFRYLSLEPKEGEDTVEIWVMNRELEELTHQRLPPPTISGNPRSRAGEIEIYYRMIQRRPRRDLPLPVAGTTGGIVQDAIFQPCDDEAMLPLYFPFRDGEVLSHTPCEPATTAG